MKRPPFRKLQGYSLDPGFSTNLDTVGINEITYTINWEDLQPGPSGNYFEVIDHDPASNCFYEPVDLHAIEILASNGLAPSEGNPQFHQQFVYTIAMKTLENFEQSLGRKIIWGPNDKALFTREAINARKKGSDEPAPGSYVRTLRLYPHALRKPNAYYDSDKNAILFGYFKAASQIQGSNLPGGVVFTCLSPDIIAHEVTHAIVDSIHPRFMEDTNPDVAAFHEAFADIVALLQRFTIPSLIEHQIASARGNLNEFTVLGELATQFGNALRSHRGALRSAIGSVNPETGKWERQKPNPSLYRTTFECHDRGSLLVSTIFDAFIRLYNSKTEDLLRIASNGTGVLQPGAIHPDLVKRLAETACTIARHLLHICIRALDYCPPVDINFGDYLRALITADLDSSPRDVNGYRIALIESFRSWGIFPDRVNTLSEESLQWTKPENLSPREKSIWRHIANELKPDIRDIVDISLRPGDNREDIYSASHRIQAKLNRLLQKNANYESEHVWASFLAKLGLTAENVKFRYEDETYEKYTPKLEVHRVRPVYRVGREGKILEQILISLTQTVRFTGGELKDSSFRGGSTLILNMSGDYDVEYIIYKNVRSQNRFKAQFDYQTGKTPAGTAFTEDMYEDDDGFREIKISHLHSGLF